MRCPFCKCDDTLVRDSRVVMDDECVRRRRECPECLRRFTTIERLFVPVFQVTKRSGALRPFDKKKLHASLSIATRKCNVSDAILDAAVNDIVADLEKMRGPITTDIIGNMAMARLRLIDKVAYIRYASVYKNFREVKDFNEFVNNSEVDS